MRERNDARRVHTPCLHRCCQGCAPGGAQKVRLGVAPDKQRELDRRHVLDDERHSVVDVAIPSAATRLYHRAGAERQMRLARAAGAHLCQQSVEASVDLDLAARDVGDTGFHDGLGRAGVRNTES